MGDEVSHSGGKDPQRIKHFVTADEYRDEIRAFSSLQAAGERTTGTTRAPNMRVRDVDLRRGRLTVYVCIDFSDVAVVDRSGKDITPVGRRNKQTALVEMKWDGSRLLVAKNGTWSGSSICS